MKKSILNLAFLLLGIISFLGCKKKDKDPTYSNASVVTDSISGITANFVYGYGEVKTDGSGELFVDILDRGFVWSTFSNPTYGGTNCYNVDEGGNGYGSFWFKLETDMKAGTTYYAKAFAKTKDGFLYGNELSFKTPELLLPTLISQFAFDITTNSAMCTGNIISDGGSVLTARGMCWSKSPNPTLSNFSAFNGVGTGTFSSSLTGLSSNTTYYVRAYATNIKGTAYGNEIIFTTNVGVGDSYQGGIIAYVLQAGDIGYDSNVPHGIIAATTDQSASAPWALTLTSTGTNAQTIGSGKNNTNTIVSNQGAGTYAAALCDNLVLGGYSDWFLPSLNELTKLYLNKDKIGGFAVAFYWSSSEENTNTAWAQSFNSNSQAPGTKTTNYNVRAVRYF
ncbi:Lcl C-terminal domain-containing protein [Aurantibacillus circumpalustris]|uniref:Lcl C-terminal domain-containing protein n=1 Tax=Aurantibacillus circumpalustris TaxID=3036359 RepID=UPI00295AC0B6|nr:DUF1566 domain-containing protein [Aurantibacillus circumpalustris]